MKAFNSFSYHAGSEIDTRYCVLATATATASPYCGCFHLLIHVFSPIATAAAQLFPTV